MSSKLTKLEQKPLTSDDSEEEDDEDDDSHSSSDDEITTTSSSSIKKVAPPGEMTAVTPTKRKRAVKGEKKRRKRRKKDPNAPKRPKTGYLRFCDQHRQEIQQKLNSTYVKEVSVVLGQMWKDLDPVEKAKYNEEFKNDNDAYRERMKEYRVSHPLPDFESSSSDDSDAADGKKKKKKKKDPNAPKTPLTGYMQFAKENRAAVVAKHPDLKNTMINQELGKMWKRLTEEERAKYNLVYKDAKKQHVLAMKQYKEDHPSSSSSSEEEEDSKKKKRGAKSKKDPNAPKAPPNSYNLYSASVRDGIKEKNPTLNHKQINRIVGQMWQDLNKEEKEVFIKEANSLRSEFLKKKQIYTAEQDKEKNGKPTKASSSAGTSSTPRKIQGKQNVIDSSEEESDDESADEQSQDEQSGSEDESESSDSD